MHEDMSRAISIVQKIYSTVAHRSGDTFPPQSVLKLISETNGFLPHQLAVLDYHMPELLKFEPTHEIFGWPELASIVFSNQVFYYANAAILENVTVENLQVLRSRIRKNVQ